jgi:hypothetical protein
MNSYLLQMQNTTGERNLQILFTGAQRPLYEKYTASQASGHRMQKVIREEMEEGRLKMEA